MQIKKILTKSILVISAISPMFASTVTYADETDIKTQLTSENKLLDELKEKKLEVESDLNNKKEELSDSQNKLESVSKFIESDINGNNLLADQLAEKELELNKIQEQYNNRKEKLKSEGFVGKLTESYNLDSLMKNISESINGEDSQLTEYETKLDAQIEEHRQLKELANESTKALASLQSQKIELKNNITEKETEINDKEKEITDLDSSINEKVKLINKLGDQLTSVNSVSSTQTSVYIAGDISGQYTKEQIATLNKGGNSYPWGQCTWGTKQLAPWAGNYWGNARNWAASARAEGFTVDSVAKVGSIIVFDDGAYGHVAVVIAVDEQSGRIQVLESNYGGSAYAADPRGIGNYRGWFNPLATGMKISYIHPKG